MRRDFVRQVVSEMERNESIMFLTGDLGFNALEPIRERFPKRFLNVGIAESHMVGMAAGLALSGKKVIVYSIAAFTTMRPYEQIRTSICYDNLDVKIVGTGGGFNYPTHGVTHHTIEDIAIMSALPHMNVYIPGYSWEAEGATKAMLRTTGPAYIRLGKSPQIAYEQPSFKFKTGRGYELRPGKDVLLVVTGNLIDTVMATADLVEKHGYSVGVLSMPSVKPLDKELLKKMASSVKLVCTIEEHSVIGGLGQLALPVLYHSRKTPPLFHSFGIPDIFVKDVGDRDYLLRSVGIYPEAMTKKICSLLNAQ